MPTEAKEVVAALRAWGDERLNARRGQYALARTDLLLMAANLIEHLSKRAGWLDIASAPLDRQIIVQTRSGHIFKAKWVRLDDETAGWGTMEEGDLHPICWDNGFCWAINSDEEPSDPPVAWIEISHSLQSEEGSQT